MNVRVAAWCGAILACTSFAGFGPPLSGAQRPAAHLLDDQYTRIIRQNLDDPRITTDLVDHLPASDTVPTPLAFFGRTVGTPGELTYAKDIVRYYRTLAESSGRARCWTIGASEEGREIVLLAIADEATLAALELNRDMLAALTDPRGTSEADAQRALSSAKPIYWLTSGVHAPERGGPEMLIELAYRLIVEESPAIDRIRRNVVTFITPVLDVDGRERDVDTYYFNKSREVGDLQLPLVYWGKYAAHDDNRDGIGQFLQLTQAVTRTTLEWHPTVVHDLHESQAYLYVSTGTGPYNAELDPIVTHEWWALADQEIFELSRRGVPGVWTYAYYDGWAPNYMFFIAHTHNGLGRFYEAQAYGPDPYEVRPPPSATIPQWFRPRPPAPFIKWGPRAAVNIQESAVLVALGHVAENRRLYLENYWLKSKRSVEKGRTGPVFGWVIPAAQRRRADVADALNTLRRQGLEVSVAGEAFHAGHVDVAAGDFIVRADQPFRTMAAMYFAIQTYEADDPPPFDDTGWTYQLLRDIDVRPVTDAALLERRMRVASADVRIDGGIVGSGAVLLVDHTADNAIATFSFAHRGRMRAIEREVAVEGRTFGAGTLVIPDANRTALEPVVRELGLSTTFVSSAPPVAMHDVDLPRIGYVHSWASTQDEGWWRAGFDRYGVPYTYFADQKLKEGGLREKYDVLIYPNVGATLETQVNGLPLAGSAPLPYKRTASTSNFSTLDAADDIRGGMGVEGLVQLARFVQDGGTLITEGSTATIFQAYGVTAGVTLEEPPRLAARGSVMRALRVDRTSPILYGYGDELPVYFNQGPVWRVDQSGVSTGRQAAEFAQAARRAGLTLDRARPRVVLQFPVDAAQMLLSGSLLNGAALSGRALVVDAPIGRGHLVMFALRPFWRAQTQGAYSLVFNTILHWNDLDAR